MARISLVALRTLGTSSARQPGRSSGARRPRDAVVAVRSWIAFRARAVVDVARPVVVPIPGREVAPAVLVQIPAVVAIATGVACGTLRAVVTLRTLRSRRAVVPRRSIRSRRPRHPVVTRVALGSLSTLGTFAIQDRAGSVVIQILGSQITLAIFVYIPAVEAVRAHRTLRTRAARIAPVTLRTRSTGVTRMTLRTRSARQTRVALGTLGTRFARNTLRTLRSLGARRTDAIQSSARSVAIHIFGSQVTFVIAVGVPAI